MKLDTNFNVIVAKVRVTSEVFESLEKAKAIESYVGEDEFILWGEYEVVIDDSVPDIEFDLLIELEEDDE